VFPDNGCHRLRSKYSARRPGTIPRGERPWE
jgi:hypothetical protein